MASDNQRQASQTVTREIRTLRIDTHHAVRQMDSRVSWNQQMADVADIRVYIFDWRKLRKLRVVRWRTSCQKKSRSNCGTPNFNFVVHDVYRISFILLCLVITKDL